MSFKIEGFEELLSKLQECGERYQQEKQKELMKIGYIAQAEIVPLIPVDTGRARASITTQLIDASNVETGGNVSYLPYLNDGHMTRGAKVPSPDAYKGITKHMPERFVEGIHFMEIGLNNAKPKIQGELESWSQNLFESLK